MQLNIPFPDIFINVDKEKFHTINTYDIYNICKNVINIEKEAISGKNFTIDFVKKDVFLQSGGILSEFEEELFKFTDFIYNTNNNILDFYDKHINANSDIIKINEEILRKTLVTYSFIHHNFSLSSRRMFVDYYRTFLDSTYVLIIYGEDINIITRSISRLFSEIFNIIRTIITNYYGSRLQYFAPSGHYGFIPIVSFNFERIHVDNDINDIIYSYTKLLKITNYILEKNKNLYENSRINYIKKEMKLIIPINIS